MPTEQIPVQVTSSRRLVISKATLLDLLRRSGVSGLPDNVEVVAAGVDGDDNLCEVGIGDDEDHQIEVVFETVAHESLALSKPKAPRKPKVPKEGNPDE